MILTDDEINEIQDKHDYFQEIKEGKLLCIVGTDIDSFARDIEQATIKKLKQKATDEHCNQAWKEWHGNAEDMPGMNLSFKKGWKWCFKNIFGEG